MYTRLFKVIALVLLFLNGAGIYTASANTPLHSATAEPTPATFQVSQDTASADTVSATIIADPYQVYLPSFISSTEFVEYDNAVLMLIILIYVMALYTLLRFISVRDYSFLFLALLLLFFGSFWTSVVHDLSALLGIEEGINSPKELFFVSSLAVASLLPFSQSFLSTKYLSPRNYTFLFIILFAFIFQIGMGILGVWKLAIWMQLALSAITMVALFVIALIVFSRGFPPSLYFLGGHILLLGIITLWALPDEITADFVLAENDLMISAAALQAILLTLGVEYRVTFLKSKKEEAKALAIASHRLVRYFPKKIVDKILSDNEMISLTSHRQQVTVFFSDLSGFTDLTDQLEPERITNLLNQYLTEMVKIINQFDGTLDKFIGDGIMAMFGAPDEMDPQEQARQAIKAALLMNQRFDELTDRWRDDGIDHDIKLRVGIHQDFVTLGNFGSNEHMSYTAIGGGVNLASRLERACSPGKIYVTYRVYSHTSEEFPYGELKERYFKGFKRPHRVSELDPDDYFEEKIGNKKADKGDKKSSISNRFF